MENESRVRRIFSNKKITFIVVPILLLLCCICFVALFLLGLAMPPELQLKSPNELSTTSQEPKQVIKLNCANPQIVTINDKELSREEVDSQLCGSKGYEVTLEDGVNTYKIVAKNTKGDQAELEISISFDKAAYEERLAQEEKARLEEEKLKQEEQAQKEAEEKAAAEAEANKLEVGDSLQGPSFDEIQEEYKKQKNLSSYKGDQYLNSLEGTKITWIAEIGDVDDEIFGNDVHIVLYMSSNILESDMAYIEDPREEDLDLNSGTTVKVTATIEEVNNTLTGMVVYLKDATVEKIQNYS